MPATDPRWAGIADLADLPSHLLDEIAHFFNVYKELEPEKGTEISDWQVGPRPSERSPKPRPATSPRAELSALLRRTRFLPASLLLRTHVLNCPVRCDDARVLLASQPFCAAVS